MAITKRRSQMVMSSSDVADVYANWTARSESMDSTTKPCSTCGLTTPDGTCPDCDPTCGTCGLLTPDGTCPDCAKATTIAQTIAQAQEVIDRLPSSAAPQNAYVYFNQKSRSRGFFFAPDDATAERYARQSGLAGRTNWLIVAVVPAK